MKILELMHNLEEAYHRFGDIDVIICPRTDSHHSPEYSIVGTNYDNEQFEIIYER